MSKWQFRTGYLGAPVLVSLLLLGYFTPRFVPSAAMEEAINEAASAEEARKGITRAFRRSCDWDWDITPEKLKEKPRWLYSWESDAGLLSATRIDCQDGAACSISASALYKPPMKVWGCNRGSGRI